MYVKQSAKLLIGCMIALATCVYAETTQNIVVNPNFDDSSVALGTYEYQYESGFWAAAWLFAATSFSGIANSSSAWGGEAATNTVVFLQNGGGVSQFLSTHGVEFTISFDLAQRGEFDIGYIDVYFDNNLIAENISPSTATFQSYEYTVRVRSGTLHMLSFKGIDQGVGTDSTVFLDNVSVTVDY